MLVSIGLFAAGILLLALGGDSIIKGASGLSKRAGLSPFATGLVLVAGTTSIPELAVNARAMWVGNHALALGNAVGSNIANFGLTLGAAALAAPLLIRWRALKPLLLCMLLATVAVMVLGLDGTLSRGDGVVLLVLFVVVFAIALALSRRQPELRGEFETFAETRSGLGLNLARIVIAGVVLWFGARFVVESAPAIGALLGFESLLTGLLLVAIGTALPEVAAAVAGARRGQGDLVAGHVIGSSLVNLLLVVGGMAAVRNVPMTESFLRLELPAALLLALMLVPMLRGDTRISRAEGGWLLVAFFAWLALELLLA